ncbi:MAG: aldose 1-epimerase family protein [Parafilimonas sp.]|nr:aldose 1-epimerase family protein [Parafilimonas sp.]
MIKIANDKLGVVINEKGAELQSIFSNNIEYLWQGDARFWNKRSPVLFPVVGELKNGEFFYNSKAYKLSRHGFARDSQFNIEQTTAQSATFVLHADERSSAVYPFKFTFSVEYAINNAMLFCSYVVKNTGDDTLYFSVGGHPAFNVPLVKNLKYSNYLLKFNNDEILTRCLLHKGLISNSTDQIRLNNKSLQLQHSLFYSDAIVLKHIRSNEIKLYSEMDEHGLNFKFDGFPFFGIWAAVDAPFVCLEPWCGIADNIRHDQQLIHKEGINKLAANQSWQRTWSVELF